MGKVSTWAACGVWCFAGAARLGADLEGTADAGAIFAGAASTGAGLEGMADAGAIFAGAASSGAGLEGMADAGAIFGGEVNSGVDLVGEVNSGADCAPSEFSDSFSAHPEDGTRSNIKPQVEKKRLDNINIKSP